MAVVEGDGNTKDYMITIKEQDLPSMEECYVVMERLKWNKADDSDDICNEMNKIWRHIYLE